MNGRAEQIPMMQPIPMLLPRSTAGTTMANKMVGMVPRESIDVSCVALWRRVDNALEVCVCLPIDDAVGDATSQG